MQGVKSILHPILKIHQTITILVLFTVIKNDKNHFFLKKQLEFTKMVTILVSLQITGKEIDASYC